MVTESAYKEPHHVMLFFEEKENVIDQQQCISAHINYYESLKSDGKVLIKGSFWNQPQNFVIVYVASAAELEQIIDNDPAIRGNALELVRAMPF
jgi:uncharacterized protein YciI